MRNYEQLHLLREACQHDVRIGVSELEGGVQQSFPFGKHSYGVESEFCVKFRGVASGAKLGYYHTVINDNVNVCCIA